MTGICVSLRLTEFHLVLLSLTDMPLICGLGGDHFDLHDARYSHVVTLQHCLTRCVVPCAVALPAERPLRAVRPHQHTRHRPHVDLRAALIRQLHMPCGYAFHATDQSAGHCHALALEAAE